ncbi:metallophosphoesterase family protein [Candidatus Pacearchaeota archaeon]|jgi:calcineurin-like phosphoesterase family protein|nr:metallophosphoesterase family protein [Candidatus Pacearchaeota archaeon]
MFKAFYSDPHLGHANIIEYCSRPFESVFEMNDELVLRYNRMIGSGDCVLWLGDCFFKGKPDKYIHLLGKMNGRKFLITGNHDQGDGAMAAIGFELVMKEAVMSIAGVTCRVCHYPYDGLRGAIDNYVTRRPQRNPGEILLHGHSHSTEKITGRQSISVGVDAWNYGPALYGEIAKLVGELNRSKNVSKI